MAQPTADEVASSDMDLRPTSNVASSAASRGGSPEATSLPALLTSAFQAVNSRSNSEIARIGSPAVSAQQSRTSSGPPTPRADAVVAHKPPRKAQATDSTLSASEPDSQTDNLDAVMAETAYGTRSRNRTNARPNYAEDQDMDFEFSTAASAPTKKKSTDAATSAGQNGTDSKRASDANATVAVETNANGTVAASKAAAAESAPAAIAQTKKRKAIGSAASALQMPASSATPPPTAARKAGTSAQSNTMRESYVMTFTRQKSCLNKKGELVADDGTKLSVNDHVYLVCEPPGDPYYLCRIMEFLHTDSDNPSSPVDSIRVNWYYRPRDVLRFSSDTRLVYGTMHSDMCPITSLRGKCTIKHRSEIADLEAYRKERDSFYFVQVFDRFIRRSYECIPVREIINVPEKVKKALDERWKFVVVEIGRVKELTSAAKTCKRCARYCASNESVDCAICKNSYHMNCVQPPLPKKPSRGFAWACGPCSRASEKKMEARNTPTLSGNGTEVEDEEPIEEEEVPGASNDTTRAPSPDGDEMVIDQHPATQAEIALAKMWPMRYLGIHARVEDALQYDDRAIYPRASSRLGPRHQANVNIWHGRPVELVKPAEIKKRYTKGPVQKKDPKLTKETLAAIEADRDERAKRPKWVQDEPVGYVARGEDYDNDDPRCTAKCMHRMPSITEEPEGTPGYRKSKKRNEAFVDDYMKTAKQHSRSVGVPPFGTNFLDKVLELLTANNCDADAALKQLLKVDRVKDLHEPVLSKSDLIKFEEGVAKYGSEHRAIRLHMKTPLPHADIVRFYYLWKKTPKGREIWGNYGGRKKRKLESDAGAKLQAEVNHDVDDSAFDDGKAARKHYGFQCKFCHTTRSRQWKRAPGVAPGQLAPVDKSNVAKDKKDRALLALCLRCAGLWRKYAIQWEDADEMAKKVASTGGKAWKRKIDEELLREILASNDAAQSGQDGPGSALGDGNGEPPKKKSKLDKEATLAALEAQKKKEKPPPPPKEPTPPPPPIIPAQPTWRDLPCAVCKAYENTVVCQHCKLTVHRQCFGLREGEGIRANGEVHWICEQCQNDRNPTVSTEYSCCLCLTEETQIELVEPPRVSHKKKTDREREKERLEKELADGMRAEYRSQQLSRNRPVMPREPLKRTTGNNWVHVYCAVWAPEIRFSNAIEMEVAEGFQLIAPARFEATCKLCKNKDHQGRPRENAGACVNCFQCNTPFHASCAFEAGYQFGFDVQPVKGSRKDSVATATLGQETGALTPIILCKEHVVKNIVHPINEVVDESGTTALQVYVQTYKQADLTLTGTVRKANLALLTKDRAQTSNSTAQNSSRRESGVHSIAAAIRRGARTSSVAELKGEGDDNGADMSSRPDDTQTSADRRCMKCDIDVTPKWHPVVREPTNAEPGPPETSILPGVLEEPGAERLMEAAALRLPQNYAYENPLSDPNRQQNPRFMAPGTNGRAWDGILDRHGVNPTTNGEVRPVDAADSVTNSNPHAAPPANGEAYRTSPQRYGAAVRPPASADTEGRRAQVTQEFLCHKCFLKKKLGPQTPPEERPVESSLSPSQQFSRQPDWNGGSRPPSLDQQFRLWDEPPPPPQVPPPPPAGLLVNGMGPPPPNFDGYGPIHAPPVPGHGYPPPGHYAPQPNGYHMPSQLPPMHDGPPAPHYGPALPSIHERHNGYGYGHQPSPVPGPYPPPGAHGQSMGAFNHAPHQPPHPPPHPPMPNGTPAQHAGPPPRQSPSFAMGPSPHPGMPHVHAEPQYHAQLPPMGAPAHSSPDRNFGRPTPQAQHPQEPMGSVVTSPQGVPPPPSPQVPPPPLSTADGQAPRPTTPRGGQPNGTGASASPNLNYLIH